ncbi:MAG TPA: hypothetical protein VFX58_00375, partial [Chitinophagaceae bacterium]|nr:hypothetical protein [Chitinophagaceae bacterium]
TTQYLLRHSPGDEGLHYDGEQLEYLGQDANPVFFTNWSSGNGYFKNNLGIRNSNPAYPLSFDGNTGQKISLWNDGSPTHYGIGIQPGVMQIHSKTSTDGIAFGYGSSNAFYELMRVNGYTTLDVKRGNSTGGTARFAGTQHITYINYSTDEDTYIRAGKSNRNVILNDIPGGKVGIGTTTPNAPLGFPATTGKKITLYPGLSGDMGLGVQPNVLQIYTDNPNGDIAFGYDNGGNFSERHRIKANGALSLNGNTGLGGQVLLSSGSASSPVWDYGLTRAFSNSSAAFAPLVNNNDETTVTSVTVTVPKTSTVTIYGTIWLYASGCFACGDATVYLLMNDPTRSGAETIIAANPHVINLTTMNFVFSPLFNLQPGTYTFTLRARKVSGSGVISGIGQDPNYQTNICTLRALVTPI